MTAGRAAAVAGLTAVAALLVWLLFIALPRWYGRAPERPAPPVSQTASPGRKIHARLFYVAEDGTSLTSVEEEVPYGETTVDQAKAIMTAQIAPVSEPRVSAIPPGTTLRALFVTEGGEAYVDLSHELASAHSGGSTSELLTVYALVNALTANLPAVTAVQLLVDGREIETLTGHVDLRRPLVGKVQ